MTPPQPTIRPAASAAAQRALMLVLLPAFLLVLLSRKPDVLLHAELWGDDGWSWYPDAYNTGLRCLLVPVNGYLNTVQRLVGLAAQPLPLRWVPTMFAAAGLLVQAAAPLFLVSGRMAREWPCFPARLGFALIVLVLPDEIEFYGNLTNAQWNLALLACLVLLSPRPVTRGEGAFDAVVLLVSGLSGPFCVFFAPIAAWRVYRQARADRPGHAARLLLVLATCAIQFVCLLAQHRAGHQPPLGASAAMLARIVSLQVLLGAELGYAGIAGLPGLAAFQHAPVPSAICLVGSVLAALALWRGPALLQRFALFAGLVMTAALLSPMASFTVPQWQALGTPPVGNRYFTFAAIAWIGMLFDLASPRHRLPVRLAGAALLLTTIVWAIPHDWREPRFPRTDFVARARRFAEAPPGTAMQFPIIPPGLAPMTLVKR